jgi:hypothetical protein
MAVWLTAFLDLSPEDHERTLAFWSAVTGYEVSPARGEHGQFVTLLPPAGDAHLRVQRLGAGPSRIHLDVHVPDRAEAADRAADLGARVRERWDDVAVMESPAGLVFCLVGEHERVPAPPARWPTHSSLVDQVCLDVPPADYVAECGFWSALLEQPLRPSTHPEFHSLERPDDVAVRILLQRRDDDTPASVHLDLACDDRTAETERHVALGAAVVRRREGWTVLRDPAGLAYCITDRDPERGATVTAATRTDPPAQGSEREQLLAFLDYHRATFAQKTGGLDSAQLATTAAASTMTLGGMLKHAALNEDAWFTQRLGGGALPEPWASVDWEARPDWEWETAADDSPDELRAQWEESVARSRALLAGVDLDAPAAAARFNARWIVVHMIEEYARHNGHADLIREAIDGETGE